MYLGIHVAGPRRLWRVCCLSALGLTMFGEIRAQDDPNSADSREKPSAAQSAAQVPTEGSTDKDPSGNPTADASRQFSLGRKRWERREFPEALGHFNEAIRLDPSNPQHWDRRGRTHVDLDDPQAGLKDYERAQKLGMNTADLHAEQAWAYIKLKQFDQAQTSVDAGLKLDPKRGRAWNAFALIALNQQDLTTALKRFNRGIEFDPDCVPLWVNRGDLREKQGDARGALSDLNRAVELRPDQTFSYYRRGLIYVGLKDHPKAIADFTRAIERGPRFVPALVKRALALAAEKRGEEALKDIDRAISVNDALAYVHEARGDVQLALKRRDALNDYNRAIELDPKRASAYFRRGKLYFRIANDPAAQRDVESALKLEPNNPQFLTFLAEVLFMRKRVSQARKPLVKSLKL
ncbi:MAG: tetratricopeptide repeat protein, partial [Planctomycetales bacterium]